MFEHDEGSFNLRSWSLVINGWQTSKVFESLKFTDFDQRHFSKLVTGEQLLLDIFGRTRMFTKEVDKLIVRACRRGSESMVQKGLGGIPSCFSTGFLRVGRQVRCVRKVESPRPEVLLDVVLCTCYIVVCMSLNKT